MLLLIVILQQPFQIRSLIEYLPCELCVGDNPPVPIVLQGTTLADIKQPAHITVVQPIGVSASFPECLVAGFCLQNYSVLIIFQVRGSRKGDCEDKLRVRFGHCKEQMYRIETIEDKSQSDMNANEIANIKGFLLKSIKE